MFMWFWIIFSLGAPEQIVAEKNDCERKIFTMFKSSVSRTLHVYC